MTQEKIKQLVSAALTFGTLSIPGFSDWLHAAGGTAEVMTLTGSLFVVIHGIYSKLHDNVAAGMKAMAVVLALLIPVSASAQEPAPDNDRGGLLLAYNLTDLEVGMDRASGWTLEGDLNIPQLPAVSVVAHVSATNTTPGWTFSGIGPRAEYDFGAVKAFAHWLVGAVKVGDMARPGLDHKGGGGLMIPLGSGRWEIQLGGDHDGDFAHGRVGIGYQF